MNLADSTLIFDPISTQISNPISIAELEAQITELAGNLNAANHRWLMLIAEFDRRDGWGDGATQSFAHWLNWKCGLDLGAAREKIRVAHALEKLPLISASMARGALSYSKVRALSRVATPETEDTLLMIALHGTASHVEKLVRQYRRAQDAAELTREALQFANRSVRYFYDDDGSLVLNARLPAESGAVLVKALEVATEDFWKADRSAKTAAGVSSGISSGVSSTVSSDVSCGISSGVSGDVSAETSATYKPSRAENIMQYRADTLALFAESFLKHGYEALSGGERQQIVIHIDAESLSHNGAGRCELEDGSALAAQTARRLSCDASVVKIIEDDAGLPLNVGRKTRSIAPAIRRALRSRDQGYRFPGCTHTRFLDGHHVRHWADGGETKLSNLVTLCRFHHRQVHEGGVAVQFLDDGALRFSDASGKRFEVQTATQGNVQTLICQHQHIGLAIDARTAVTRWCGGRMDYGMAVGGLIEEQARKRPVSSETPDAHRGGPIAAMNLNGAKT